MKYVVYKQPLSLDRFFVHEVTPNEASISKLENAFVLVQDYLHFGPQSLAAPRTQTQNKELYLEHKNTIRLSTKDIYISRRKDTKDGSHNHTT